MSVPGKCFQGPHAAFHDLLPWSLQPQTDGRDGVPSAQGNCDGHMTGGSSHHIFKALRFSECLLQQHKLTYPD